MGALLEGSRVLVTGASSGIGREMARQVAPKAGALVLVARRRDRLDELRAELTAAWPELEVIVAACDIADRAAVEHMLSTVGDVDVLINNAGFGDIHVFAGAQWPKLENMIAVNVTALAYLTHRLVGPMVSRGRGGILNVSSGLGLLFMPGAAVYAATKHFVTAFTEALRVELIGTGVTVTQVCPGPVETEFGDVAGLPTPSAGKAIVEISAAQCARAALRGLERGRPLVVPGFVMGLAMWFGTLTPRWLMRLLTRPVVAFIRKSRAPS